MSTRKKGFLKRKIQALSFLNRADKFILEKRQRFILSVAILTIGLFYSENLLGKSSIYVVFLLSFLTSILFFWSNHKDIRDNFSPNVFILPLFYSLAFGLFYFLIPARFLTRLTMTTLYAIGLYSLFLAQNIFVVASIRTIALTQSAKIVSFVITLISYFFIANVIFSLDWHVLVTFFIFFLCSFFLILQSLWTITLEKSPLSYLSLSLCLALCLSEASAILWFWPSSATLISLFLTGYFYTIVGLSHAWLERKLFKNVMWEYIWVGVIVLFILILFTSWRG